MPRLHGYKMAAGCWNCAERGKMPDGDVTVAEYVAATAAQLTCARCPHQEEKGDPNSGLVHPDCRCEKWKLREVNKCPIPPPRWEQK